MSKILETESEGYGPSFAIHGFMRYLGLRPAQLVAYALIYSCTVDRGCYDFGAAVLADWSGTSERTARTTIASLLEMGLIVERGSHVHGTNTVGRALVAAADPVSRAREAWKADHPGADRAVHGSSPEESSREKTSSPAISSREDSSSHAKTSRERTSSPAIFSGETPYIPISNDYPEDWMDGWNENQTNQPDVYPEIDFQVDTAADFRNLTDETINRNKLDEARHPYDELRKLGFGADEIRSAWARRQAGAKDAGTEDKFMPQLRKWLLDTSVKGCRKMVEAERRRSGHGGKRLRQAPDGTWLIIGDGPVHPVVDASGIAYRGDQEGAIALAREQSLTSL